MASRKLDDCTPELQVIWAKSAAIWKSLHPDRPQPFPTTTYRDNEEQEILYMRDKNHLDDDGDGLIDEADEWRSNAKPGLSDHNKYPSPAMDIAFKDANGKLDWSESLFREFADIFKQQGGLWGGDWKKLGKSKKNDTPHYYVR